MRRAIIAIALDPLVVKGFLQWLWEVVRQEKVSVYVFLSNRWNDGLIAAT
jgi:hypothetical protein